MVLNRPWAVAQWVAQAAIPERRAEGAPAGVPGRPRRALLRPWVLPLGSKSLSNAFNRARLTTNPRFVLMAEPDHLWLSPMPNPIPAPPADGDASGTPRVAGYPFFYIEPAKAEFKPITEL